MVRSVILVNIFFIAIQVHLILARRSQRRVLVVSLDGFHYDYLNQFDLPAFRSFAENGVHAVNGLKSMMTTKTLPIHWSLATGMYQEDTGFVGNWMYDPKWNESFKMNGSGLTSDKWLSGEPIWITAKKQGKKTGVLDWIGSDVQMKNEDGFPDKYLKYNSSRTFKERLGIVFDWFVESNLNLVMMYHNEPDQTGHRTGAGSDAVRDVLTEMDKEWHKFIHKWNGHQIIQNKLSIILLSDHGMVNISNNINDKERIINYLDYFETGELNSMTHYYDRGVISNIFPKNDKFKNEIVSRLKSVPGIKVYLKNEIPDEWHFRNNSRIGDILIVADEGNQITDGYVKTTKVADHGYSPDLDSMKPFFAAYGNKIPQGNIINDSNIETINVHSLVCKLLKIEQPEGAVGNWSLLLPSSAPKVMSTMFTLFSSYFLVRIADHFRY